MKVLGVRRNGTAGRRCGWALLLSVLLSVLLALCPGPARAEGLPGPVAWPLDPVRVLRPFDPPAERWSRGHRGVDLAASVGQPVRARADGLVSFAGPVAGRPVMVLDHGALRSTYEPVTPAVDVGARVRTGQVIGRVVGGSHCPQTCLHWGLISGRDHYLDPMTQRPEAVGEIRLLAPGLARQAARRAAARAAEALIDAAVDPGPTFVGAVGRGGFRHPVPGRITSGFGMRLHPVLNVWKLHDGTDFGAACGTPIVAPAAGRVRGGGYHRAYGQRLTIDHGRVAGRRVVTGYNHAVRYVVTRGESVRRGQLIGFVGSTGHSTGCHLHLMVWLDGHLVNPMTWFAP